VAVLAAAARLPHELAFDLLERFLADRLAVGDLRPADVRVDLELAHHAVDDDLEVQLAHAAMIVWPVSSSVWTRNVGSSSDSFCSEAASLSWSAFVFGSIATLITGSGNFMASRMIGVLLGAQRITRARVLETDGRGDVARVDLLDLLAPVRVHLQQTADALALVLRRVVDVRAGGQ
jgi:hypothetical protein